MNRSDYEVVEVTPTMVKIVDLDRGNKSVTNDAENVTRELFTSHGNKRFIYRDSDGYWDELLHQNGRFTRFSPYIP